MKKAVVSGALGALGSELVRHLLNQGLQVWALTRDGEAQVDLEIEFGAHVRFVRAPMDRVLELPRLLDQDLFQPSDSAVFYHLAWKGDKALADGGLSSQMENAALSANAVVAAKKLGCTKFVNVGSFEETRVEHRLASANIGREFGTQVDYALAKLSSRDMCRLVAYLEKIDYVHTRFSVIVYSRSIGSRYMSSMLERIRKGFPVDPPNSSDILDVVSSRDAVEALYRLGEAGKNGQDYYIGNCVPGSLLEHFTYAIDRLAGRDLGDFQPQKHRDSHLFSTQLLQKDTGFLPEVPFSQIVDGGYLE